MAARAPPGSTPSALRAVALVGAQLSRDRLCLILTLIIELLGASVDLMSARPMSSGSTVNFREQLRSGSSSSCVWPQNHPGAVMSEVTSSSSLRFTLLLMLPR